MRVEVFYPEIGHVATVSIANSDNLTHNSALEYAFFCTQNLEGSWSLKEKWNPCYGVNGDDRENVTVRAPLTSGSGHRSSMMGDKFIVVDENGEKEYVCAMFGFDAV